MNSTFRCKNCDKRRTWLEQSLYTGQLTGRGYGKKCNKEGTCKKNVHQMFFIQNFASSCIIHSWIVEQSYSVVVLASPPFTARPEMLMNS